MKAWLFFVILLSGVPALAQVPVIDNPEPSKTFHSPLNGERKLDDQEGRDYVKLQQLYDLWQDDLRAEVTIGARAMNSPEYLRARALALQTDAAFHAALDQYVEDWSGYNFPKRYRPAVKDDPTGDPLGRRFKIDRSKVMASILEHSRSVIVPTPKGTQAPPKRRHRTFG